MSIIYRAQISPTKNELAQAWIARQPWFTGDASAVERAAALRWDDPAGEVGVENLILTDGAGGFFLLPVTYRGAELPEGRLITEMDHSVLGRRWVYEGLSDPVYLQAARDALASGVPQAPLEVHDGDTVTLTPPSVEAVVVGAGDVPEADVVVNWTLDPHVRGERGVRGTWEGQEEPVFLITL